MEYLKTLNTSDLAPEEYGGYFSRYIDLIPADLSLQQAHMIEPSVLMPVISRLSDDQAKHRYAPGKWSIKEVIMHLIDTERIFNYRALRYARQDETPLIGYDHDRYAETSQADHLSIAQLLEMYEHQRKNTSLFFKSLDVEALERSGVANDYRLSVRAIGFFQLGHEIHHTNIIKERYLESK